MGNFTSLEYVDLTYNDFTGSIPREFGLCTRLRWFYVGATSDLGIRATQIQPVLGATGTYVSNTGLVGGIPKEMGHLPFLTEVQVTFTSIGGRIPDFSNATTLSTLDPGVNELEGIITTQHLPASLELLALSTNRLTGSIPPAIGNLSNLLLVTLSYNDIEGEIPSELGLCSKLQWLELGGSSISRGPGRNMIRGSIPKELGQLVQLRAFTLFSTQVSGTIPAWLGNFTSLSVLVLSDSELSGGLPTQLSNLTSLEELDVATNRLDGSLSVVDWSNLRYLTYLFLSRNRFSGHIPGSLGMATSLYSFAASELDLVGSLPLSLKNNRDLSLVDLQSNRLSGNISDALDVLADTADGRGIRIIMLSSNRFQGSVPTWIGSRFHRLRMLLLGGNSIEGSIPATLSLLPRLQEARQIDDPMQFVVRTFNEFTNPHFYLTLKNVTMGLHSITFALTIVGLSNNHLEGGIPSELSDLVSLRYLNVSHNHLSGSIPPAFSNPTSLVQLHVSNNDLSGSIHSSLASMDTLDYVDFSSNKLVGPIPFGTKYDRASYVGNSGLCGEILNVSCLIPPSPSPTYQQESRTPSDSDMPFGSDMPFTWIGFWIGCGISFLVTVGLFLSTERGLHFIFGDTEPPFYIVEYRFYRPPGQPSSRNSY